MGQAWCKEKTSKAQDSKSPLDRVFVRCAHRIYPSLKEEGSVLGGATQRVTSSEIGYAGSPPRDVLTRGRSIDSVDRPFQPSDWVDVNLEVPSTPRANSVLTNLTIDTNLYPPTTTPTSIRSNNLKDVTPVPPPRRKKRNRGRPLPPKPDEILEKTSSNLRHVDSNEEPLYSSVVSNSPRTLVDDYATMDDVVGGCREQSHDEGSTFRSQTNGTRDSRMNEYSKGVMPEGRRTKEIYEHKKTSIRLEDYIQRHGSTENLSEYQVLEGKLPCSDANSETEFLKYDPSKLEDWDLGDIGNCELNHRQRPLECSETSDRDVVDFHQTRKNTNELQKPESFGKPIELVYEDTKLDETLRERDRCPQEESKEISKPDRPPSCKESFCLNQNNPFYSDSIDDLGSSRKKEDPEDFDGSDSKRMTIFGRSLSNESEPCDPGEMSCETKELRSRDTSNIISTISEESLPRETLTDNDKLIEDEERDLKMKRMKTPPPSPENKIKSDNSDNEHSVLLKVLKEEAADGSNFSSMTPSLTELEVALSDMLEKEQNDQENVKNENIYIEKEGNNNNSNNNSNNNNNNNRSLSPSKNEEIETKSITIEKNNSKERLSVSLDDILKPKISSNNNRRKVSFCAWEEKGSYEQKETIVNRCEYTKNEKSNSSDLQPTSQEDSIEIEKSEDIPTPPRRRHRPSCPSGILREDQRNSTNGAKTHTDAIEHDDRLI